MECYYTLVRREAKQKSCKLVNKTMHGLTFFFDSTRELTPLLLPVAVLALEQDLAVALDNGLIRVPNSYARLTSSRDPLKVERNISNVEIRMNKSY